MGENRILAIDDDRVFRDFLAAVVGKTDHRWVFISDPWYKILYASGCADNVLFQDGRLVAGVQFINKPFRKADLAQKVRDVLDQAVA